eukprot:TRINITY_DN1133_c0_g1::TRINITY_DN1133_c0_g1_i1::g.17192::m.17192 TRINITY_DN1133_c0_g1::TRINITY_DN1133_c0_g1_i1::g.17192  ORF type:complete len:491 (-),score=142.40,sp/A7T167/GDAP2_NEMVE/43.21/5e-131,CRAL_TRIO_2/PF13716.1/1.1e-35,Macro/PF01661.16/1.8e-30,CRAL_TRIO/PF00650.15/2.4e-11 TRINITY_DN1133_c0_g1_i1:449-1921(-)
MSRFADPPIDINSLPTWDTQVPDEDPSANIPDGAEVKFPIRDDINRKIALWFGPLWRLQCHAVVNTTNEQLTDRSGLAGILHDKAGPELEQECYTLEGCRTGEAKLTKGYKLPARHVIHTVGPRYNVKYRTAAENALHHAYRNCLEVLAEGNLRNLGFCVINTERKGYPRRDAAHIAIRTVRRFLEHYGEKVDKVVFCVGNEADLLDYQSVLPLYCPRNVREVNRALVHLPEDTGNEFGETTSPDREIRIGAGPADDKTRHNSIPAVVGTDYVQPEVTVADRAEYGKSSLVERDLEEEEAERLYLRYVKRSRTEDLTDIEAMRIIYRAGVDQFGRPIFVFVAKHLDTRTVDLDRVFLWMVKLMDRAVNEPYTVVYVHTMCADENQPEFSWLKKVYTLLGRKYKKNLQAMYVVHPTWVLKAVFWFVEKIVSEKFWRKVLTVEKLVTLFQKINSDQLRLPDFVLRYDYKENGPPTAQEQRAVMSTARDHDRL